MLNVAIFDYGAGNIFSLKSSILKNEPDSKVDIITSFDNANGYDTIFLPGVGNFDPAIKSLRSSKKPINDIIDAGIPVFGICMGMEMLFDKSEEGTEKGLGILHGEVVLLPKKFKIPHMGWNDLQIQNQSSKILHGIENGAWVYFVHSYRVNPVDESIVSANADYGIPVPAVIEKDSLFGTQFHPEKSGKVGATIIKNFLKECKR